MLRTIFRSRRTLSAFNVKLVRPPSPRLNLSKTTVNFQVAPAWYEYPYRWVRLAVAGIVLSASVMGCSSGSGVRPRSNEAQPSKVVANLATPVAANTGQLPLGIESVYPVIDTGTLQAANDLLENIWDIPRSPSVKITNITWTEDPFHQSYWRFIFYSLRPTSNLLWAFYATGERKYLTKLLQILASYTKFDAQLHPRDRKTFDNKHASAFREMILVNTYVKLQASHDLPASLQGPMLASIHKLGVFLATPENFDPGYNHGFNESVALLLVATNFPHFAESGPWGALAKQRLDTIMTTAVDNDGVEVEKSPFYDFYVLDFALDLENWARTNRLTLPATFLSRVASMTDYAAWITLPDGLIPLVGSSVRFDVARSEAATIDTGSHSDPNLQYAASSGARGRPPTQNSVLFPISGTAVLRASWASGLGPTDIYFDAGAASTDHSQLAALQVDYYSSGATLLSGSGLYTYTAGPEYNYFHGSSSHNLVTVDGQTQEAGPVTAGKPVTGGLWSWQSATARVYSGVVQRRGVLLLKQDLAIVVDEEVSDASHRYQLLWHLTPGESPTIAGDSVRVTNFQDRPVLSLQEIASTPTTIQSENGLTHPFQGWYSENFGVKTPSEVVASSTEAGSTSFATLIASGQYAASPPKLIAERESNQSTVLDVCGKGLAEAIHISNMGLSDEAVSVTPGGCALAGGNA